MCPKGKRVRNETNRRYCVAGGWCLPVRVGLFHEADLPFRIHFCGFGNCVTPRRRGGAFQQRSVLIQIRTPQFSICCHSVGCGTTNRAPSATQSATRNLFCFLGLGLRACSPYLHRRDCATPKPRKKKQKRYDFHRFSFPFLCSHK
jgi:hypothetical protein